MSIITHGLIYSHADGLKLLIVGDVQGVGRFAATGKRCAMSDGNLTRQDF